MGLLNEAVDLIISGRPLEASSSQLEGRPLIILSPMCGGGYVLQDAHQRTPTRRFRQPTSAVRTFYRLVGAGGLARAVSFYQYRELFPQGSSLDWPPKPLGDFFALR